MAKVKIYLAAPFNQKEVMRQYRATFLQLGYPVTSSWIDEPCLSDDLAPSDYYLASAAQRNLADMDEADILVVFPGQGAGHHTELGYMLAFQKLIIVAGNRNNVFHYIPTVLHVPDLEAVLQWFDWKYGHEK